MNVLIVDDSPIMRKMLRRDLRRAGFDHLRIEEADDGAQAFEMLRRGRFDVVSTGWNMPNMGGRELLEHVTLNDFDVVAGVISAHATKAAKQSAQQAGAAFFVSKPFTPDTLRAELAEVLR